MNQFRCFVQEGSAAHLRGEDLERRLHEHHAHHYPGEQVTVNRVVVPPGYMFTGGRPSTSSVVIFTLDHETTLDSREEYMRGMCDLWTEVTGCTKHEIVIALKTNQE